MLTIERIFISTGHNYFGHHGRAAGGHPVLDVEAVECVAGRGLRGDRFFGYRDGYKGQVTLFAAEVFAGLCAALACPTADPAALRRNLFVRGADLNALIGQAFELQGVWLLATEECRPCHWMDEAIGPGAEAWLKSRGGLRCQLLSDGWLRRDGGGRT